MSHAYVSVAEAVGMEGLRIAFSRGVPGPWSESARALFDFKRIPYIAVSQDTGGANEELMRWTGQTSAPVAVYQNEKPRDRWSELLLLAERLAPEPRLIPSDQDQRAAMFGLCHEICGEDGLGWNARLLIFDALEANGTISLDVMRRKYCQGTSSALAPARIDDVLDMLARRLNDQERRGIPYFVGTGLSAADLYWTAFSNLVNAIPADVCPMDLGFRASFDACAAQLLRPVPTILITHRDRILRQCFTLPMQF